MTFQDPWVVGSRLYLRKDRAAGLAKPTVDLGIIQQVTPSITSDNITLNDPDGGRNRIAATASSTVTETYQVQCANLSLDNLAIALQGTEVTEVNRAASDSVVTHEGGVGGLVSLRESAEGERAYGVEGVSHVIRRKRIKELTVTNIDVSTGTITFLEDHGLATGDTFIITKYSTSTNGIPLTDLNHAGEYEVDSTADVKTVVLTAPTALLLGNADEENVSVMAYESEAVVFSTATVTDIDVSNRLITFDAAHGLSVGDQVIVTNSTATSGGPEMVNPGNVGTYQVQAVTSTTVVEINIASAAQLSNTSESAIAVDALIYTAGVDVLVFNKDFQDANLDRGLIRLVPVEQGGGFDIDGDIEIGIQLASITGRREFVPQEGQQTEGELELWFSRDGFSKETVRYASRASIILNSSDFSVEDFSSVTFEITILSGDGQNPFGFMRQTKGDAQTLS